MKNLNCEVYKKRIVYIMNNLTLNQKINIRTFLSNWNINKVNKYTLNELFCILNIIFGTKYHKYFNQTIRIKGRI